MSGDARTADSQHVEVPVAPVSHRLESARRELLDLGLRNSLINYRALKSRGVEVTGESPAEIFRILVRDGRRMSFQPAQESRPQQGNLLLQPEEPSPGEIETRQRDAHLQTGETSAQLQSRLLQTFYSARTFIEEQGANILYLALGMLDWYETDTSEGRRRAPLVLVPVTLDRSNALDRFHLRYSGDDIGDNLSLAAKLHAEFAIDAPSMPEMEDLDVDAYFDAFDAAVASHPRWQVDRGAISLGFFSFGKFLMYRDLDITTWPPGMRPDEHHLVRALLSPEGFDEPPSGIADEAFIDPLLNREEIHEVVDADSSQTLAMFDVNAGRNLVIQGPPGTGKSQTITNIIAEAIGGGKTVLFVAEKMAALEVVKRRLDQVGLGDACLELHSHKINKRSVLQELQRTLELGRPRLAELEEEISLLDDYRERLNAYCEAVNAPVGESGVTPYRAYGELARVRRLQGESPWPRLQLPAMAQWTAASFTRREAVVRELQARIASIGIPAQHPFWGSRRTLLLPSDRQQLAEALADARAAYDALQEAGVAVASLLRLHAPRDRRQVGVLRDAARRALSSPVPLDVSLASDSWLDATDQIRETVAAGKELAAIRERRAGILIPEAWQQDLLQTRQDLAAYREKWWRQLSGTYRRARRALAGLCVEAPPKSVDEQIALVDDIMSVRRHEKVVQQHAALGSTLFGPHWNGTQSSWDELGVWAEWLIELHRDINARTLPSELLAYLANPAPADHLRQAKDLLTTRMREWDERIGSLGDLLEFDAARRSGATGALDDQPYGAITGLLTTWTAHLDRLDEMVAFNLSSDACIREGLEEVITAAERWPGAAGHLIDAFHSGWYTVLLERALRERPALSQFDSGSHEHIIERFRELDRLAFERNRSRLAVEHWNRLPRHEGGGQLATLRREFEKRSRHLPIRRLMERSGKAIQAIKPVFMMGPLSIATYIPPGTLTFDLVIFDEASQVRPVDAFGALVRGHQAVVVGDSRQLPPTSFFDTLIHTDTADEEEESTTDDIESILGLFTGQNAPQRMLRWHYRSRHESLIAVSNREFYESRLIIFPSPDAGREQAGLVLRHLASTSYDRGGSRTNRDEAAAVARAVMSHAGDRPHLTLGVAAFSAAQTGAILAEVERLRRLDPSREGFFAAHPHEPFFVKNLENVQGDERDVILISVGYGRSADGHLTMNFGPLNSEGGERRLNVLITRARLRCEVYTSITADDIDLNRTSARGVAALKQFLHYAQTGVMDMPVASGREADSPFEEAVYDALTASGFRVEKQVGSAGFFIDLAIVDPARPGRYVLGIECDGASYHSARSARDRDRLRQQVLEGLGWRMHRIWSTDWFRNPDRELRRAVTAIEEALASGVETSIPTPPVATTEIRRDDTPVEAQGADVPLPYVVATPRVETGGRELHVVPLATIAAWVVDVVEVEGPVHTDEVARRIAAAAGAGRVGARIRAALDAAIAQSVHSGKVMQRGEFLSSSTMEAPAVRDRSSAPASLRSIQAIAPEEVEAAIAQVVEAAYGMEPEQIPAATCRLLGLTRVTDEVRAAVASALVRMLEDGQLKQQGSHVVT
jgi:very-short-patch-repair endonuclease